MTSSLVFPIRIRGGAIAWRLPILLPVLPFLALAISQREFAVVEGILGCFAMLVFGAILALGVPAIVERCGWAARKEAEQLRPAWLTCLFLVQLPALTGRDADETPLAVLFTLACALVATFSFGAEFQQRTVPGLLSQPVDRRRIWATKMKVLGVALMLLWASFCLTLFATEVPSNEAVKAAALGLAGVVFAGATTPWGTLLTRSMLAGLVTALPLPFVGLALTALAAEALERMDPFGQGTLLSRVLLGAAVVLLGPGYIVAGFWGTRRCWIRLEASDPAGGDAGGGVFFGRWKSAALGRTRLSWARALVTKELRLQTVTIASLALLFVSLFTRWALPLSWTSRELFAGFGGLFGLLTILLAGATPIAEERRLGTLEGHVLLPVSRRIQWWVKLALAVGLAGLPIVAFALFNGRSGTLDQDLLFPAFLVPFAFAFGLLASSANASALRALLLGLGLTACAAALVGGAGALAALSGHQLFERLVERAMEQPDLWFERARLLDLAAVPRVQALAESVPSSTVVGVLALAALVPLLSLVAMAGRNFARPAGATQRLPRQLLVWMAAVLVLEIVLGAAVTWIGRRAIDAQFLSAAWQVNQLQQRLTPAEIQLQRHSLQPRPQSPFELQQTLQIRVRRPGLAPLPGAGDYPRWFERAVPTNAGPVWTRPLFSLPLTPAQRAILIADADIPEPLRDLLRREAAAKGDTNVLSAPGRPPGPWPDENAGTPPANPPQFQMSPELMRRYGLMPAGAPAPAADPPTGPASEGATPPPAAAPATSPAAAEPPPPFQMSPELMRRYGLVPPPPALAPPATNPPITPSNAPKAP